MKREYASGGLLPWLPTARRERPTGAPGGRKNTPAARSEAFRAQTFPHIDAVYSDAFCLTGDPEDAADLVVETYVRAFRHYERFRRGRVPEPRRAHVTLAWLYGNMHACFCDKVLARTRHSEMWTGGRP